MQLNKETANIWEYKVGNNANIVNFACVWQNPSVVAQEEAVRTYFRISYLILTTVYHQYNL